MDDILVTVYCAAYNHEKYIRDTLEGFINQKTKFKYEIIVHDDASIDNTAIIIEEYVKKYPEIIIPIVQKENIYSQGINYLQKYINPIANGKYFAICEGDDYWIDPYKLQKQVDYMEANPDCTFCFTNGYIENVSDNNKRRQFVPYSESDKRYYEDRSRIITIDEIYQLEFVPTASFMYKKRDLERLPDDYWLPCPTGDLKMRLYFSALGYGYFLNEKTCVYRENVPGSVMTTWKKDKRSKAFLRSKNIVEMIDRVDVFSGEKHTKNLHKLQDIHIQGMLNNADSLKVLNYPHCKQVFFSLNMQNKIKILIKILIPNKVLDIYKRRLKKVN